VYVVSFLDACEREGEREERDVDVTAVRGNRAPLGQRVAIPGRREALRARPQIGAEVLRECRICVDDQRGIRREAGDRAIDTATRGLLGDELSASHRTQPKREQDDTERRQRDSGRRVERGSDADRHDPEHDEPESLEPGGRRRTVRRDPVGLAAERQDRVARDEREEVDVVVARLDVRPVALFHATAVALANDRESQHR
jgi:hypothetical protein